MQYNNTINPTYNHNSIIICNFAKNKHATPGVLINGTFINKFKKKFI